jgi:hypothetical protein
MTGLPISVASAAEAPPQASPDGLQLVKSTKTRLAAEFKKILTDELQNKGGYEIVTTAAPDVLVLRPALLNVEVNAPDLMTASFGATASDA